MANHLIHPDFVGAYVYAIIVNGVVRYIGKGRRYRAIEHFRKARELNRRRSAGEKVKALPFHNRLAKAMRNGARLKYRILAKDLSDAAAYAMEAAEIAAYPEGQLWNANGGGFGGSSEGMKRLWLDIDFRARTLAAQAAYRTPEFRDRQRDHAVSVWADPDYRERWMQQHRAVWDNPEKARERRALLKKVWANPELKAKKSALVKSQWTPERRAAHAENRRKAWADPEFKARASASIRASKKKSADANRPG